MSRAQGSTPTPRVEPGSGRRVRSARARRPGPHGADVDGRVPAAPSPLERPGPLLRSDNADPDTTTTPASRPVVGDLLFIGEPTRRSSPPPGLTSQRAGRSGGNRSAPHSFLPRRLRSARAGEMHGGKGVPFLPCSAEATAHGPPGREPVDAAVTYPPPAHRPVRQQSRVEQGLSRSPHSSQALLQLLQVF